MGISFEKKIFFGFIINVLIVGILGWLYILRIDTFRNIALDSLRDKGIIGMLCLSILLLIVVYFIIRNQLIAKNEAQNSLFENKKLLQSIIDNTSSPISIKKLNGEYIYVNKTFENLFKISNENAIGKTDWDFLPKEIADKYRDSDLNVAKVLTELKTEETIMQEDGAHTYIAIKFPLYDSEGRIYAIGGIATDISERKKMENSLLAANEFFNISLDMLIIATNEKFIKVNPAVSRILGYTEEELLSKPFIEFTFHEDVEKTKNEVTKLKKGELTLKFENRYICKDGSLKTISWTTFPDLKIGLLYAVARDITAQKEIENALITTDKFFNMSYDMFLVIKNDAFEKVNPAFVKIIGYDEKELKTKSFLNFIHPEYTKSTIDTLKKSQNQYTLLNFRTRINCKDNRLKWLEWTSTYDVQSDTMYAIARDVTELVAIEESLKMANTFFNSSFDILTVVSENQFIKINTSFTKTVGYEFQELEKIKFIDIIHPDDIEIVKEAIAKLKEGVKITSFKSRICCKDGSFRWFDWNTSIDLEHRIQYSVARDITEKVELEIEREKVIEELYENEGKLRLIVENISEGVIVANSDKKIVIANEMAYELFSLHEEDSISPNLINHFELYFPDQKTIFPSQNLPLERALNGEATDDVDIVLWDPDKNEKKRVLISGRPLIDKDNNVVAAVVTIKDISKYKQLEENLIQSESKYRELIGFKKERKKE